MVIFANISGEKRKGHCRAFSVYIQRHYGPETTHRRGCKRCLTNLWIHVHLCLLCRYATHVHLHTHVHLVFHSILQFACFIHITLST